MTKELWEFCAQNAVKIFVERHTLNEEVGILISAETDGASAAGFVSDVVRDQADFDIYGQTLEIQVRKIIRKLKATAPR